MAKIFIGTSGWSYDDWVGPFYDSKDNMFSQYMSIFNTVEINSTFYEYPSPSLIMGLARIAPMGFKYSAKMPRLITHKKKFNPERDVGEDIDRFLKLMDILKKFDKLGVILIQLPPISKDKTPWFKDFIEILPSKKYRFAVEFRDMSWLDNKTWKILSDKNIAYCIVDEPLLPPEIIVTSDFSYIRWHGHGRRPWYYYEYSEEELREWVPRIKELSENVKEIYGYFNNHFRGYAPKNALQMLKLLGKTHFGHEYTLKKIEEYFTKKSIEETKEKAEKILSERDIRKLLEVFAGSRRLERAIDMPNEMVRIDEIDDKHIVAKVKDYIIEINMKEKYIMHNCDDWHKRVKEKKFCKHVCKLFLMLPEELSLKILGDIVKNIDEWKFK